MIGRGASLSAGMSWNDMVIEQFRAGHERIADMFDRASLVVLHTTGAKTGEPRLSPLVSFSDGGRLFIVASAAGADRHPAWYHNLVAHPRVQVERWAGDAVRTSDVTARVLSDDERGPLWQRIVEQAPGFGGYQEKTDRVIPVVELQPSA